MRSRAVFIGFSYPHHGEYSGYDRIAQHVDYDLVLHADRLPLFRVFHRFAGRSKPLKLGRYTLCDPLQLFYRSFRIWARWRCAFLRGSVVHFAYPETGVVFTRVPGGKDNCYVATLHLPAASLYRLPEPVLGRMRQLDHIILVSDEMYEGATVVLPDVPMTFIPHGVESSRFSPDPARPRDHDILMLGNWLRDFSFARKVFESLHRDHAGLSATVVALPENLALLNGVPGLECRHGISDDALLELMQRTRILFLPLRGLTANNAILEAAACGCRICLVLPDAASSSGYFEGLLELLPPDADAVAHRLAELAGEEPDKGVEMALYAHEHYRWEKIGAATELILKTLMA